MNLPDPKEWRTKRQLSQAKLAERLGISATRVGQAEAGDCPDMFKLALLGIEVMDGETKIPPAASPEMLAQLQAIAGQAQPKKRRGLGRSKDAIVHGITPSETDA